MIKKIYKKLKRRCLKFYYQGHKVKCIICETTYRRFRPYGVIKRKNAFCPNCGSLERHRLLWAYGIKVLNLFKLDATVKLLHVEPERFFYDKFDTSDVIEYVAGDLYPERYRYTGSTKLQKLDITKLKFSDNTFDYIFCNHVLEHIPNDTSAMSELYRVLKNGGIAILQVPINEHLAKTYEDTSIILPDEREKAFGQKDHVRVYGQDYTERLESVGFKVNIVDFVNTYSQEEIFKFGFSRTEKIYHCTKP